MSADKKKYAKRVSDFLVEHHKSWKDYGYIAVNLEGHPKINGFVEKMLEDGYLTKERRTANWGGGFHGRYTALVLTDKAKALVVDLV
jgi:hypothetical protein